MSSPAHSDEDGPCTSATALRRMKRARKTSKESKSDNPTHHHPECTFNKWNSPVRHRSSLLSDDDVAQGFTHHFNRIVKKCPTKDAIVVDYTKQAVSSNHIRNYLESQRQMYENYKPTILSLCVCESAKTGVPWESIPEEDDSNVHQQEEEKSGSNVDMVSPNAPVVCKDMFSLSTDPNRSATEQPFNLMDVTDFRESHDEDQSVPLDLSPNSIRSPTVDEQQSNLMDVTDSHGPHDEEQSVPLDLSPQGVWENKIANALSEILQRSAIDQGQDENLHGVTSGPKLSPEIIVEDVQDKTDYEHESDCDNREENIGENNENDSRGIEASADARGLNEDENESSAPKLSPEDRCESTTANPFLEILQESAAEIGCQDQDENLNEEKSGPELPPEVSEEDAQDKSDSEDDSECDNSTPSESASMHMARRMAMFKSCGIDLSEDELDYTDC